MKISYDFFLLLMEGQIYRLITVIINLYVYAAQYWCLLDLTIAQCWYLLDLTVRALMWVTPAVQRIIGGAKQEKPPIVELFVLEKKILCLDSAIFFNNKTPYLDKEKQCMSMCASACDRLCVYICMYMWLCACNILLLTIDLDNHMQIPIVRTLPF